MGGGGGGLEWIFSGIAQLYGAIYRPDSFVLIPHHCVNLKAIRYESTSLNRVAADISHRVNAALLIFSLVGFNKLHGVTWLKFEIL